MYYLERKIIADSTEQQQALYGAVVMETILGEGMIWVYVAG